MFFLFPLYIFGLSIVGSIAIYVGVIPLFILLVTTAVINVLQVSCGNLPR